MNKFIIKSVESDLKLILSDMQGEYFKVQLESERINAIHEVWAYTDAYEFSGFMNDLAAQDKPWSGVKSWGSIENDFVLSAKCSSLGQVTFEVELSKFGSSEEWQVKTHIVSEFGQLPNLAKSAKAFFGASLS